MLIAALLVVLVAAVTVWLLLAAGVVYALVWLAAFSSPLGHRLQMQRLHGRAGAARQGKDALAAFDRETQAMTKAAIDARRARRGS